MNTDPHIASVFDRDLEAVQALVMRMGGLVEQATLDVARALETRDEELARRVLQGDRAIDALEAQVHEECARVIALRQPTAADLRIVLSVLKVAASLERMGDYAKNIAKRTSVLAQFTPIEGTGGTVRRMAKQVEQMLKDALDAYIRRDAALAADVRARDQEVDQIYNSLFRVLLTHMLEDPRHITACMHLHFIAKNVERMGDHATGIAEQVIYLVTGEMPDEPRPKDDRTPFVASVND
ncbi:MAG: phosphate signaling complex protein PhoU [Gemmobacter sp.]